VDSLAQLLQIELEPLLHGVEPELEPRLQDRLQIRARGRADLGIVLVLLRRRKRHVRLTG
jgi:hypothetical protein